VCFRSKWISLLFIATIFFAACSGTPANSSSTNSTSHSQSQQFGSGHKLFVFLSGFTSTLSPAEAASNDGYGSDPDFFRTNGIQPFLLAKFPGSYFLTYSYSGFNLADGKPLPYTCPLTVDDDIADLAVGLRNQISQFLRLHPNIPNTDVYVIGHSLGGVIAFSFLAQLVEGKNNLLNSFPNGGALKGVFTLDSPVGGVSDNLFYTSVAKWVVAFYKTNCNGIKNLFGIPVVKELNDLFNSATQPESRGSTASTDKSIILLNQNDNQTIALDAMKYGVKVSTFGNTTDVLWQPSLCNNNFTDFLSTQWVQEVQSGINKQGGAVYARTFTAGVLDCSALSNKDDQANHFAVLTDPNVQTAIWQVITGHVPDALMTVPVISTPTTTPVPVPTPTKPPSPTPSLSTLSVSPSSRVNNFKGCSTETQGGSGFLISCPFVLSNSMQTTSILNWSVSASNPRVIFDHSSGTLAPGQSITINAGMYGNGNGSLPCPFAMTLVFKGSVNTIQVPLICTEIYASPDAYSFDNTHCSHSGNWVCIITVTADLQNAMNTTWVATVQTFDPKMIFSPMQGTLAPGATLQVTITILNSDCPGNNTFFYYVPGSLPIGGNYLGWSC
jgi:hypothetical protein